MLLLFLLFFFDFFPFQEGSVTCLISSCIDWLQSPSAKDGSLQITEAIPPSQSFISAAFPSPDCSNERENCSNEREKIADDSFSDWPKRAYLATYPRSGNHWIRYLVEEASHVASSSVYRDGNPQHLSKLFPWGGYCCKNGYEGNCRYPKLGEMVLVKTHYPAQLPRRGDALPYEVVFRIVRHPLDSIYSYYVYSCGPLGLAQPAKSLVPKEFVEKSVQSWRRFQEYWNEKERVITICYEDLLTDPAPILKRIVDELGYSIQPEDIVRAVKKFPPQGVPLKHLNKFLPEHVSYVYSELGDLMDQFGYSRQGE